MRLDALGTLCALLLAGCGGDVSDEAAASGAGDTNPFLGVYDATYTGTSMTTSPPMPANNDTGTGVITVEPGTDTDLKMTIAYTGSIQATCVGTFARDGNTATFSPMQQPCDLTSAGGAQTNTNSAEAEVNGSTLAVHVYGSFTGTSMGSPYSGTFDGNWTGTRR